MSITFLIITCTDCTFRGSSLVTAGRYLWNDNGRTFQFDRRLGLCLDCNKVVAIEDLPDAETMERARSVRQTYLGQPLFSFIEPDYAKYLASQDGFDVLEQVIELMVNLLLCTTWLVYFGNLNLSLLKDIVKLDS